MRVASFRSVVSTTLVFGCVAFIPAIPAQTTAAKPLPLLPRTTNQGLEGGFWKLDKNYDPVLHLKNVLLKQALDVVPSIYFADGTEFDLPSVHLDPAGVAAIRIRTALLDVPSQLQAHLSQYGMVGVKYSWSWPAVIATIQNTDEIASLTIDSGVHADAPKVHASTDATSPQIIEGMWWLPSSSADGFIAISNTALGPCLAQIELTDQIGKKLGKKQLPLKAHQTALVKLSDLLGGAPQKGSSGGITIRYNGAASSLMAIAGIEDEVVGFSATPALVELPSRQAKPAHSVVLNAPGLMLGKPDPSMLFPVGTYFTPYTVLRNISANPLTVALSLTSDQADGHPATRVLDNLALAPGQTMPLDYTTYFGNDHPLPDGFGELSVAYTGQEGDLLFQAGSVDQTQNFVFGVTTTLQSPSASKTICYWSIEADNDSMISIWNWSAAPEDLVLTLLYHGGQYRIPLHLDSRKAYNLDLMDLARSQAPDPDGNIIPPNITNGSALLSSPKDELATISVAASTAVYNVRNATCGVQCQTCNGITSLSVVPDINVSTITSEQAYGQATMNTGSQVNESGGSWTTGSIATVNSTGVVAGVSPGATTTTFSLFDAYTGAGYICEGQFFQCPTGNFSSQAPTVVSPVVSIVVSPSGTHLVTGSSGQPETSTQMTANGSPAGGSYSWTTSSSAVTLSGATTATVTVTASSAGQPTLTVKYTVNGQSATATQSMTVQQPAGYSVYGDSGNQTYACYNGDGSFAYNGVQRTVNYQLMDNTSPTPASIKINGIQMTEAFQTVNDGCGLGGAPPPVNGPTFGGGKWGDGFVLCVEVCKPSSPNYNPNCKSTFSHQWSADGTQVLNRTVTYSCTSITP